MNNPNPATQKLPALIRAGFYFARLIGFGLLLLFITVLCFTSSNELDPILNDIFQFNDRGITMLLTMAGGAVALAFAALFSRLISIIIAKAVTPGRHSPFPNVMFWATSLAIGVWGFFALWIALYTFFSALNSLQGSWWRGPRPELFLPNFTIFLTVVVFLNPLWLLAFSRYHIARQQAAAHLILIQAANLIKNGVSPLRALADAYPARSPSDAIQARITQALREKQPFAHALANTVPGLTRQDAALLHAAQNLGILGPVLLQKADDLKRDTSHHQLKLIPSLIIMEWALMFAVFMFTMLTIFPKFRRIFQDFGVELPIVTKNLMYFSLWLLGSMPGQVIPGLAVVLFVGMLLLLGVIFLYALKDLLSRLMGRIYIPIVTHAILKASLAQACFFLSHALRAGVPLPQALQETQSLHLSPGLKTRLASWQASIHAGLDPATAAQDARLPPVLVAFIRAAQSGPALGDALERLARHYQTQSSRTWTALSTLVMPMMIILTGLAVGFLVVGLFVPLVKLIQRMT